MPSAKITGGVPFQAMPGFDDGVGRASGIYHQIGADEDHDSQQHVATTAT